MNKYLPLALVGSLALTSCFKDEPANSECDITEAYLHADNVGEMFYNPSDTMVKVLYTSSDIIFNVRKKADLKALAPHFTITPGATISPANGSTHDFSNGSVEYTVTSEDGAWKRKYKVSFVPVIHTKKDTLNFDFEDFHLDKEKQKYYVWSEKHADGNLYDDWASGNGGFWFTHKSAPATDYPTAPLDEGYEGKGVKLTTRDTGPFGQMVNMPLAAGNLFLGAFDMSAALTDALKATMFGLPFDKKPKTFSGYYKYQPGEKYQDKNQTIIEGKTDKASIYAILYLNHDENGNAVTLDGNNAQTSPLIVATAIVNNIPPTDNWTQFKEDFRFIQPFSQDILENRGYSLAIVFSSSADGDFFQGAIGSTLCIDNVRIVCETEE